MSWDMSSSVGISWRLFLSCNHICVGNVIIYTINHVKVCFSVDNKMPFLFSFSAAFSAGFDRLQSLHFV